MVEYHLFVCGMKEALLKQKRDRENESKRQNDDLDEQLRTILSLEEKLMKSKAIISQAKEGVSAYLIPKQHASSSNRDIGCPLILKDNEPHDCCDCWETFTS